MQTPGLGSILQFDGTNFLLAVLGLGALVAFHEAGHLLVALWTGMKVRRYSIGFGPAIFTRKYKGVDYTIGAIPFGGFVDVLGNNPLEDDAMTDPQSYQRRPRWARAAMVVAGPAFNYGLAWVILLGLFAFGGLKQDMEYMVKGIVPGSAAEKVGLKEGDVVVTIDGKKLARDDSLPDIVGAATGRELELNVRRGDETLTFRPTPVGPEGEGKLGIVFEPNAVGVGENYSMAQSVTYASRMLVVVSAKIVEDIARMLRPGEEVVLGGPVAIVRHLKQSAELGVKDLLWKLAILSIMLGLLNMLPIPPLDGSKLLMLVVEMVGRREIPAKAQAAVQGVGFLLMIVVMIVVTKGDIFDPDKGMPKPKPATETQKPAEEAPAPSAATP